jgi:Flp pilus assembly pilin Flp
MRNLMLNLWNDDAGALIATEWVFIATIMVLGIITGLVAVRQALLSELTEFANAVLALNQSFSFSGQSNCSSFTGGSAAFDVNDFIRLRSFGSVGGSFIEQPPCD